MRFNFGYTGIRVQDLDGAIDFFTRLLGMKLQSRINATWNKGEFANLVMPRGKHYLELNWYAEDSPVGGPFREGDELDHLGFEVDDFEGAIQRLKAAGYPPVIGPHKAGNWDVAFVKGYEGIWLDIYHINPARKPRRSRRLRGKR